MARMERQGLCMHTVTLTAKDKICFREAEGRSQMGRLLGGLLRPD